jgi:hypothetical protein
VRVNVGQGGKNYDTRGVISGIKRWQVEKTGVFGYTSLGGFIPTHSSMESR